MKSLQEKSIMWDRIRWPLLAAGVALIVIVAGIVFPACLRVLGVHAMVPTFIDLVAILAAGEANQLGWDVYVVNSLDPLNRPHVYGPWWLFLGHLGFVRADSWWMGSLLIVAFLGVGAAVLAPRNCRTVVLALLLLASPPALLAMERGNNDLVIFLLLATAVWLVTRTAKVGIVAGGALMVVAAALKLYPLVALPALAARKVSRRCAWWVVGGTAVVCAWVLLDSLDIYHRVAEIAPKPLTIFAYGFSLSVFMLSEFSSQGWYLLIGGGPLIALSVWICWRWRRDWWSLIPISGFTAGCYVAGGISWAFCYFGTINFAYRMILLLLPARLWLSKKNSPKGGHVVCRFQLITAVALGWTPLVKEHLFVVGPDDRFYGGSYELWMFLGLEYALALVISGTLVFAIVGWAWRRFIGRDDAV